MPNISIYEIQDSELKKETQEQANEIEQLKAKVAKLQKLVEASLETGFGTPTVEQSDLTEEAMHKLAEKQHGVTRPTKVHRFWDAKNRRWLTQKDYEDSS